MEIRKQASIHASNRSIETLQEQLQTERSRLAQALQQYGLRGSWLEALEQFTKEIEEAEVQELTSRVEIARYLQRLEELDNQVSYSASGPLARW